MTGEGRNWRKRICFNLIGLQCHYVEKHFMSCAEALRRCSQRPQWLKQDTASGWWRGTLRCCWSGMRVSPGQEHSRCCGRQPVIEHCCCPIVKLHFNSFSIIITICFPYRVGIAAWEQSFAAELYFFLFASLQFGYHCIMTSPPAESKLGSYLTLSRHQAALRNHFPLHFHSDGQNVFNIINLNLSQFKSG